jgi:endogenous inhibitor of DNA gyrase (YacG/DUF329 family)
LSGQRAAESARIVRCPGCGGASVYASSNPFRPFCGERCRLADLGTWASDGYRVGAAPGAEDEGSEGEVPSPDAA